MMTHKQRMLAVIKGQTPDRLPWVPRLDLWYNARNSNPSFPAEYKDSSLMEIVNDLDVGYHAVIPHYLDIRDQSDTIDRGLGIYRLKGFAYKAKLTNVERIVERSGDQKRVTYKTPVGSVSTTELYTEDMKKAGVSLTHISEYAIKELKDYDVIGYIFDNIKVTPDYDNYRAYQEFVGDNGIAVAYFGQSASPMHHIMKELMPLDKFFYAMYDHSIEVAGLIEKMTLFFDKCFNILADSPAEVILSGANYHSAVTNPPFFKDHILPWLKKFARILHDKNKYLLTHCDGENDGLLDLYLESEFDIADSICPYPMTKLTISDVLKKFDNKITAFGGVPSVILLKDSMSDGDFDEYMKKFLDDISGHRVILGISDTTPANADFDRLLKITELIDKYWK